MPFELHFDLTMPVRDQIYSHNYQAKAACSVVSVFDVCSRVVVFKKKTEGRRSAVLQSLKIFEYVGKLR